MNESWTKALALSLLLLAGPVGAEKTSLVLSIAPGDTLRYTLEMGLETNFGYMPLTGMEKGKVRIVALEKSDDTMRLSIHFSDFEILFNNGDGVLFDERKSRLNGVTVEATVSRRGEVLNVRPDLLLIGDRFTRGAINLADNLLPYLPDAEVESGASWVVKRLAPNTGHLTGNTRIDGSTEFTLDKVKKKEGVQTARILGKSAAKVTLPWAALWRQQQGVFEGKASGASELLVAVQGGHLLESKSSATFVGVSAGNDLSWTQTLRVKLVK